MKFRHVNVHNVTQLVPNWVINPFDLAKNIEFHLASDVGQMLFSKGSDVFKALSFWIEVDTLNEKQYVRFVTPTDSIDLRGNVIITSIPYIGKSSQIVLPLNPFLKGYPEIEGKHVVYCHSFQTDVPLAYFGISKRPWFERFAQHVSSAKSGSPYLFHRAIFTHNNVAVLHRVFYCDLNQETALEFEEKYVDMFTLYPLGLNMIPGGNKGIKYLSQLGINVKVPIDKEDITERLSLREDLSDRPNPLCAARWASDPSFAERVICGHSGRLTVDQVKTVRLLSSYGKQAKDILDITKTNNLRQIKNVINNKTYQRIN